MQKVKRRNAKSNKVKINFDVDSIEVLIKYMLCDVTGDSDKRQVQKLMAHTDIESYREQVALYVRLKTLETLSNSMVDKGLREVALLKGEMLNTFELGLEFIGGDSPKNQLSIKDTQYVRSFISEKLQYIDVYKNKDKVMGLLSKLNDTSDYATSYYQTFTDLKSAVGDLLISLNGTVEETGLLEEFSFSDPKSAEKLAYVLNKAQKPTAILQTGIRQLNALLSPGFHGGRLYTILGGSGKFKSGTLLNIADQIRSFNPQINPFENGRRKAILFVTLENSIEESIERIYDMYSEIGSDFRKNTVDSLLDSLASDAGFSYNSAENSGGIDIIFKYRQNLSINTSDIDAMITDLESRGFEIIGIIVDYIKRLDSIYPSNGDERIRISNAGKELKNLAQSRQRPVITAMQLNRGGNAALDDAVRDSRQDITRFVGSSSIGNAWDIIEDSDWVAIINLELQKSTNRLFLTFKRTKMRGKKDPNAAEYFNHPFVNSKNIRLEPDVHLDHPLSVISLATDLDSIDEDNGITESGKDVSYLGTKLRERTSSNSIKMKLHNS